MNHKQCKEMMSEVNTYLFDGVDLLKNFIRSQIIKSMEDEIERLKSLGNTKELFTENYQYELGYDACLEDQITHLQEQIKLIQEDK